MIMDEIRKLTDDELAKQLEEAHRELFNLRFRAAANQLTNYNEVRKAKKSIARIKTVIRERELSEVR
jgi:large subunit ribosomal protein L29